MTTQDQEHRKLVASIFERAADGANFQYYHSSLAWQDRDPFSEPELVTCYPTSWRVKPEPRSWYACDYGDDSDMGGLCVTREEAEDRKLSGCKRVIKLMEVVE